MTRQDPGSSVSYITTRVRVVSAILAGAVVGATVVAGDYLFSMLQAHAILSPHQTVRIVMLVFVGAFVVWLLGLGMVGCPLWWVLHRRNVRGWPSAVLIGVVLTFLASFLLTLAPSLLIRSAGGSSFLSDSGGMLIVNTSLTTHGWIVYSEWSLLFSVAGALAGWVVWRVAYRRSRPMSS